MLSKQGYRRIDPKHVRSSTKTVARKLIDHRSIIVFHMRCAKERCIPRFGDDYYTDDIRIENFHTLSPSELAIRCEYSKFRYIEDLDFINVNRVISPEDCGYDITDAINTRRIDSRY